MSELYSEARLARIRLKQQGIFVAPDAFEDEGDVKRKPSPTDPAVASREILTVIPRGPTVAAQDYAMKWKDPKKVEDPSSTHELDFYGDYVWVSGFTTNKIARVWKKDPSKEYQVTFEFPKWNGMEAVPHTLRFAPKQSKEVPGMLYVSLEYQGRVVKIDTDALLKKYKTEVDQCKNVKMNEDDFDESFDVRMAVSPQIPVPINTHPHAFCFCAEYKHVYFTGKLTNTIGRVRINGPEKGKVQHYEIPTLGAVPIYLAKGPDKNIWGTCLNTSIIVRITDDENPVVDEIHISTKDTNTRPIAIIPDPRPDHPYMWFSTEAQHAIGRLDVNAFEREYSSKQPKIEKMGQCVCSVGCKNRYRGSKHIGKIIINYPIPKVNRDMKMAGLAITKEGCIYTQSYMDPAENMTSKLHDYIIRIRLDQNDPGVDYTDSKGVKEPLVNMTGVPIELYQLPTKDTILHRVSLDQDENVWFTEENADRLGTLKFKESYWKDSPRHRPCRSRKRAKI